jgi:hypothetical protein
MRQNLVIALLALFFRINAASGGFLSLGGVLVVIDELLPREDIPSVGGVRNVIDELDLLPFFRILIHIE